MHNILFFVLDTLREDHSSNLSKLEARGFVKYQNAITPSPWTFPSHISMFTGLMPSKHYAHERIGAQFGDLLPESRKALASGNVLSQLRESGYHTYGFSAVDFISPYFGYEFDHYESLANTKLLEFARFLTEKKMGNNASKLRKTMLLIQSRKLRLLSYIIYYRELKKHVLRTYPLDKGSKQCLALLSTLNFQDPFFLYVNLFEAHEPYYFDEGSFFRRSLFAFLSHSSYSSNKFDFQRRYPIHANLSISRLFEMLELLAPLLEKSIVIVTSDHGQMLGESGKFGHSYFLNDEVLKVPLYVKYPASCRPIVQHPNSFVNLTEMPKIFKRAVSNVEESGDTARIGSDISLSESFGPHSDNSWLATNQNQLKWYRSSYTHRLKLYSPKGSAIYDVNLRSFLELEGDLTREEAKKIIKSFLAQGPAGTSNDGSPPSPGDWGQSIEPELFTDSERLEIENRLKSLGYS